MNNSAQSLLEKYVKTYSNMYGKEYITCNVHNLIHLHNDVLSFGHLDIFCAFPFEKHMQHIKKKISLKSHKLLQQAVERLSEKKLILSAES